MKAPVSYNKAGHAQIDFVELNQLALQHLLSVLDDFLKLDTEVVGKEVQMLNPARSDNAFGSFSINRESGAWADFAEQGFKGGDVVSLVAKVKNLSQLDAAKLLGEYLSACSDLPMNGDSTSLKLVAWRNLPGGDTGRGRGDFAIPQPSGALELRSVVTTDKEVPEIRVHLPELGLPSAQYQYLDADGLPIATVCRFDHHGKKTYRPFTLESDATTGKLTWLPRAPEVRPLYNLHLLGAKPDAQVIFCEGEKTADAAAVLFPDAIATTTMNGALSADKSDFSPLAGRKIIIAPDNDEPGRNYANAVHGLASKAGAVIAGVLTYPSELFGIQVDGQPTEVAQGYDLADALQTGWTAARLKAVLPKILQLPPAVEAGSPASKRSSNLTKVTSLDDEGTLRGLMHRFVAIQFNGRVVHDGSGFRAYRGGYWPMLNQTVELEKPLALFLEGKVTPALIKQVMDLIKIFYSCDASEFGKLGDLVCVQNGTLAPVSGTLLEHNWKLHLPNRLEVEWSPGASCPIWEQTLQQIFEPDADGLAKIRFLQEFIGYCLIPDTTMHKFLWLVGRGGNGKSLVLSILEELVGRENVSHAQLDRIQDKFARAELQNKLVNISSEMSAESTVSDGYLKQIVAGDMIEAERKYQPSFSFKPTARLVGATNELPRLLDHSDGFFRRAVIIKFNRQFSEAEQDRTLLSRLQEELPGILAWAVTGLQRLKQRGNFEVPASSKEALAQYRRDSDPVQQFAEEFLRPTEVRADWVAANSLYAAFRIWALDSGYRAMAEGNFKNRLLAHGFSQHRTNKGRFWALSYTGRCPVASFGGLPTNTSSISPLARAYQV